MLITDRLQMVGRNGATHRLTWVVMRGAYCYQVVALKYNNTRMCTGASVVKYIDKEGLKSYLCFFPAQRYDPLYDLVRSPSSTTHA